MSLDDSLNKEELLFPKSLKKGRFNSFERHGIFSIGDFINCDIDEIFKSSYNKDVYKTYQNILKYKYLNVKLNNLFLLDNEYLINNKITSNNLIMFDLYKLGFERFHSANKLFNKLLKSYGDFDNTVKMIDIINKIGLYIPEYKNLAEFYIDSYNKQFNHLNNDFNVLLEKFNKLNDLLSDSYNIGRKK